VSSQLQALPFFPQGKDPLYTQWMDTGWNTQPAWTLRVPVPPGSWITFLDYSAYSYSLSWGQGEAAGSYQGHHVTKRWHWWPEEGSSYSPGVVDANYSLSAPRTVCAWWRATSYERWPCCAEHSRSKGVNLEKQSSFLWCECHAYGMNDSGWVCH